jgi:pimeloyl-ACP methyl ester carboxylesterase
MRANKNNALYEDPVSRLLVGVVRKGFKMGGQLAPGLAVRAGAWLMTRPKRTSSPALEMEWLLRARRVSVSYAEQRLAVLEWGDGPAVLFVHGWCSRGLRFSRMIAPLLEAGFRVVVFDAPAHGRSSGTHINILQWSEAILAVTKQVGPIYGLVAHSIGVTASVLALESGLKPEKVVFVSPLTDIGGAFVHFSAALHIPDKVSQGMIRHFEAIFDRSIDKIDAMRVARQIQTPPLLVFHDKEDPLLSHSRAEDLVKAWQRAELISTSGNGHHSILDDPGVVRTTISFLSRAPETTG